ncbi:MAG: orotidine-5'-phosphate decarboxylase [Desulfobacterales bacterium]|nr:orotidine-5'-phosphate decarboxylase [Desulfobacterales bacterium]
MPCRRNKLLFTKPSNLNREPEVLVRQPKDYLVFPLDVPTMAAAADYVRQLSACVGIFKVGLELFVQCGPEVLSMIREKSDAAVFLDLKLHDIPATVGRTMARLADYGVDFATVHCGEGRAMLESAVKGGGSRVSVLGVTVLTSVSGKDIAEAGFLPEYSENVFRLVLGRAKAAHSAGCAGIVCSGKEVGEIKAHLGKDFVAVTPGIRPAWEQTAGDDQERIVTPAEAIAGGSDYLVIGRPIRDASDPAAAARRICNEIAAALT